MLICDECSCENIQKKSWVDCETESVLDEVEPNEYFCPDCEEIINPTEVNRAKWVRIWKIPFEDLISQLESIGVVYNDGDTELDMRLSFSQSVDAGDLDV